jgi:hypothetical protein
MNIRVTSSLSEFEQFWNLFSTGKSLWARFDIACCFHSDDFELCGRVLESETGNVIGFVPLVFEKSMGRYTLFGGTYPEQREWWVPKELEKYVISSLPTPLVFFDLLSPHTESIAEDFRYHLKLSQLSSLDEHFASFSPKHRKNLMYDIRRIKSRGVVSSWSYSLFSYEQFVGWSVSRFGEESDLFNTVFVKEFFSFLSLLEKEGCLVTLQLLDSSGVVVGVEYAAFYNAVYYILNGGYSLEYPNAGKLLIYEHMQKAFSLGAKEIDVLNSDTGWKALWKFSKDMYYVFRKV